MGAELVAVPDSHGRVEGGRWHPVDLEPATAAIERAAAVIGADGASGDSDRDAPLAAALRESGAEPGAIAAAIRYVEQYHAAPAATVSTAWVARMEATTEGGGGGDEVQAAGGLDALPRHLADELPAGAIRYGTRVRSVDRRDGWMRIRHGDDSPGMVRAGRVIITFPPPLTARVLDPDLLPGSHRRALGLLRMGSVVKVGLRFHGTVLLPAGPGRDTPSFLHADGAFPTWWTASGGAPAVVAWAGGTAADALAGLGRRALVGRAIAQLATMTRRPAADVGERLAGAAWRDWSRDPLSGGAYAHAAVGGARAADVLAVPIDGVVFLAGEAISQATGTVDGAWNSGLRAARQLLAVQ